MSLPERHRGRQSGIRVGSPNGKSIRRRRERSERRGTSDDSTNGTPVEQRAKATPKGPCGCSVLCADTRPDRFDEFFGAAQSKSDPPRLSVSGDEINRDHFPIPLD